jgi:hypothetical protein
MHLVKTTSYSDLNAEPHFSVAHVTSEHSWAELLDLAD